MIPKTILLIDDEVEINEILSKKIKAEGHHVYTAFNGVEALEQLKDIRPDLILLDLNMPVMSGIDFYQKICDSDGRPQYPVLIMTGLIDMEQVFKDFHIDGFITKPFHPEDLIKEIENIFQGFDSQKLDEERKLDLESRRIIIVDNDPQALEKIAAVFKEKGYQVQTATDAVSAVEKIREHPIQLALINLNLPDIPGDLLTLRLKQMATTASVTCILYVPRSFGGDAAFLKRLEEKSGIRKVQEYTLPNELLEEVNFIYSQGLDEEEMEEDEEPVW